MSSYEVRTVPPNEWPPLLTEIPQPPKELWAAGTLPSPELKLLAVVGSRQYTSYGKEAVDQLLSPLAGYPIGIISGLAIGIDALAHEAALRSGLYTMAVPGSGLFDHVLYPARNRPLARHIIEAGGGLLSELPPDAPAAKWTFPQRNRIMAGMSHATLLIEAGEKSGTLITARMCVDYNRELLAVPGNIFSRMSAGTNQFIKLGATPVTSASDILDALHLVERPTISATRPALSAEEERVLALLASPLDRDTLLRSLQLDVSTANILLMQMEMDGYISVTNNVYVARL